MADRIPKDATPATQNSIRDLWEAIDRLNQQDLQMQGRKIRGVGVPTASGDAATKEYVDTAIAAAVGEEE